MAAKKKGAAAPRPPRVASVAEVLLQVRLFLAHELDFASFYKWAVNVSYDTAYCGGTEQAKAMLNAIIHNCFGPYFLERIDDEPNPEYKDIHIFMKSLEKVLDRLG